MSVQVDMEKVAGQTVRDLGGQYALLLMELNALRAANAGLEKKLAELTENVDKSPGDESPLRDA